jgi:hypothetical protein
MKKNNHQLAGEFNRISRMGIILTLILFLQAFGSPAIAQYVDPGVRSRYVHSHSDSTHKWFTNWNILFHAGATSTEIDDVLRGLKNYIEKYIAQFNAAHPGNHFQVDSHMVHCPCDPLLYNMNTTPSIGASGSTTPPPPPPGHGLSGDLVAVNNFTERDLLPEKKEIFLPVQVKFHNPGIDKSKTLAVMDTGLDGLRFANRFNGLLWEDPGSKLTLRNFQFYHNRLPLDYMEDDDAQLHGTAVTTVALMEFEKATVNSKPLPRIMVLKVLDETGLGNSFSTSCALSYIAQKKATLINASLGYYSNGIVDPILLHYVDLCSNKKSIPMLAAAGNTPGRHNPADICGPKDNARELTKANTFDPASYSTKFPNVISVTTLKNSTTPCRLQNFSVTYVSVGVVNDNSLSCCKFLVPFLNAGYEGSSFATPFVSGKIMACLTENSATLASCEMQWRVVPAGGPVPVTKGGKYIDNR